MAPAELEGCLLSHPHVSDACVVGIPDDYSGELPLAYVVLSEEAADRIKRNSKMSAFFCQSIIKVGHSSSLLQFVTKAQSPIGHSMLRLARRVINT